MLHSLSFRVRTDALWNKSACVEEILPPVTFSNLHNFIDLIGQHTQNWKKIIIYFKLSQRLSNIRVKMINYWVTYPFTSFIN